MVNHKEKASVNVFTILCVMGFFAILSSTMSKSPVLKPLSLSLGTPTDWTGVVAAASTIPGILISLPAASLSDIFGRRRFLLVAGILFASAPFLYLLIGAWWQLILVRLYHGFATAVFVPVAEASIAELFPNKRGERISLFSSATYLARVSAPVVGGYILFMTASDFQLLYLCVAVSGVTALIAALPLLMERRSTVAHERVNIRKVAQRISRGWRSIASDRSVLFVSSVQACLFYAYGSIEFYLAGYLLEVVSLNDFLTGIVIMSIIAVGILARPYMGRLSDRVGRRLIMVLGLVVSGLPLLAVPFSTDFWLLLLLMIIFGFGFACVTSSSPALISELAPQELIGTSIGFLDTVMDVGQAIGPIVSGLILAVTQHYTGVFLSVACLLLLFGGVFTFSTVGARVGRRPL